MTTTKTTFRDAAAFSAAPLLPSSWSSSLISTSFCHTRHSTSFLPAPLTTTHIEDDNDNLNSTIATSTSPSFVMRAVSSRPTNRHHARVITRPVKTTTTTTTTKTNSPSQSSPVDHIVNSITPKVMESTSTVTPTTITTTTKATPKRPSRRTSTLSSVSKIIPTPPSPKTTTSISKTLQPETVTPSSSSSTTTKTTTKNSKPQQTHGKRSKKSSSHVESLDNVPDLQVIPSVTAEETQYLNEQLEKRKQEKLNQATARQSRPTIKRSSSSSSSSSKKKEITTTTSSSSTIKKSSSLSSLTTIDVTSLETTTTTTTRKRGRTLRARSKSDTTATLNTKTKTKSKKSTRSTAINNTNSSMQDTFRAYMKEISQSDLLEQAEVAQLARQIREGMAIERAHHEMEKDLGRRPSIPQLCEQLGLSLNEVQRRRMLGTAAKNTLVSANLRLVTSVANKLSKSKNPSSMQGLTIDDMVQEGSVGLIRAAEKFDITRGYKFSTYATWWIRAYVMRSITNQGRCIKVPASIVDEYVRIRRAFQQLKESNDTSLSPTDEQVASYLGITTGKLKLVVNVVTQVPASLDVPIDIGGDSTNPKSLGEIVQGDDHVEQKMVEQMEQNELDSAMKKYLKPVERAVIRLRYGLEDGQPRSFREIGELLGLSKERIRQIVFRSLPKLKTPEIQRMLQQATTR